jgi:hypothetical protein
VGLEGLARRQLALVGPPGPLLQFYNFQASLVTARVFEDQRGYRLATNQASSATRITRPRVTSAANLAVGKSFTSEPFRLLHGGGGGPGGGGLGGLESTSPAHKSADTVPR